MQVWVNILQMHVTYWVNLHSTVIQNTHLVRRQKRIYNIMGIG